MQLGFVNFNTEEKKRVSKMMQLLSESRAIEMYALNLCGRIVHCLVKGLRSEEPCVPPLMPSYMQK